MARMIEIAEWEVIALYGLLLLFTASNFIAVKSIENPGRRRLCSHLMTAVLICFFVYIWMT